MRPELLVLSALLATAAPACDYPGGPPGAVQVEAPGEGIVSAVLTNATGIYRHGVWGEPLEAAALRVSTSGPERCHDRMVWLEDRAVFEDRRPLIADVTGDGLNDVIVVETALDAGARLAVYGMAGDAFAKLAETPALGRPGLWLAPVGVADFDGNGVADVALVETPHLDGTLELWTFAGDRPRLMARRGGVSNHVFGQDRTSGGIRHCGGGPEIVLASADWSGTVVARLEGFTTLEVSRTETPPAAGGIAAALDCKEPE